MKKRSVVKTVFILTLLMSCILPLTFGCSSKNNSNMQESNIARSNPYPVPADKAQKWEALQNVALKDYDVCQEHCGYEQNCLDRCEAVYKARLAREYEILMNK